MIIDLPPATIEGYLSWSLPITGYTIDYAPGGGRQIIAVNWFEIVVAREGTNPGVDAVLTGTTQAATPPFLDGSPLPDATGTWTRPSGSEYFAQLNTSACRLGESPEDGLGVSAPSAAQTIRFTPDDAEAFATLVPTGGRLGLFVANDEPISPFDLPSGQQLANPSEWYISAAQIDLELSRTGGYHYGIVR